MLSRLRRSIARALFEYNDVRESISLLKGNPTILGAAFRSVVAGDRLSLPVTATVLMREIRERGYAGGITQLRDWLLPMKQGEVDPVVRFETPPGQQMQGDFTHVRRGRDPLLALVSAFKRELLNPPV